MKTQPTYNGNILTKNLQEIPDGTIFSEHVFDGLAQEPVIYKKIETLKPYKDWPLGDILVEPMSCGQYAEVPGERCRLGFADSEKEWRVWSVKNIQIMIGWFVTSDQHLSS